MKSTLFAVFFLLSLPFYGFAQAKAQGHTLVIGTQNQQPFLLFVNGVAQNKKALPSVIVQGLQTYTVKVEAFWPTRTKPFLSQEIILQEAASEWLRVRCEVRRVGGEYKAFIKDRKPVRSILSFTPAKKASDEDNEPASTGSPLKAQLPPEGNLGHINELEINQPADGEIPSKPINPKSIKIPCTPPISIKDIEKNLAIPATPAKKLEIAGVYLNNHCISVNQIAYLALSFDSPADKLALIKLAYPKCPDKDHFYKLHTVFEELEDKRAFKSFNKSVEKAQ